MIDNGVVSTADVQVEKRDEDDPRNDDDGDDERLLYNSFLPLES